MRDLTANYECVGATGRWVHEGRFSKSKDIVKRRYSLADLGMCSAKCHTEED